MRQPPNCLKINMPGQITDFLKGKTEYTLGLFRFFMSQLNTLGMVNVNETKMMIVVTSTVKFAYVTQLGKNFIHVVFPFKQLYPDNLCFKKMAQVPGSNQFNHHFRMLYKEDINEEILKFMQMAHNNEQPAI